MPRQTTPTPAVVDNTNPADFAALSASANGLTALQQGYGQGRDLVNQLLGQAQAFQAAGNLLQTFGVSKLAVVKENKLYQQLAGSKTPNGLELKGTWAEFCGLLGVSDEKANQDIANLQAFGEAALEQMQRVGIGYRDLRQFRKLPTDQKTALIEAAKAGDKDTLLELAEDLIAKHAKEKEVLTDELAELKADNQAKDEVLDATQQKLTKAQLAAKKKVVADTDWPDALQPLADQVAAAGRKVAQGLSELEICRITLFDTMHSLGEEEQAKFAGAMAHIADVYEETLDRSKNTLAKERSTFDKTLGDYGNEAGA
jgi:hypothetical protein